MRKTVLVLVVGLLALASLGIQPALAEAPNGAFAFEGTAALPQFPCQTTTCSGGSFSGTAAGAAVGLPSTTTKVCVLDCAVTASFSYIEAPTCPAPTPAGAVLFGSGNLGGIPFQFTWVRIGLVAVIALTSVNNSLTGVGAGAAVFVPSYDPLGPCPQAITAEVVGAAVVAGA